MLPVKRISIAAIVLLISLVGVGGAASAAPRHHHASSPHVVSHVPTPIPSQWRTAGPGIAYPDATDPTRALPRIDQLAFDCIRYHESRNHVVDGVNGGSEGWYQFTPTVWHPAAVALGFPAQIQWNANAATRDQQSAVAVWYFKRNGRFGVEWLAEVNSCPGVFVFR